MPNQTNAPYSDEFVEAIEQAAKEVVEDKFYNRHGKVALTSLGGESGNNLDVVVRATHGLSWLGETVDTNLGKGCVRSVYPTDGSGIRVSVRFNKQEAIEKFETQHS